MYDPQIHSKVLITKKIHSQLRSYALENTHKIWKLIDEMFVEGPDKRKQ